LHLLDAGDRAEDHTREVARSLGFRGAARRAAINKRALRLPAADGALPASPGIDEHEGAARQHVVDAESCQIADRERQQAQALRVGHVRAHRDRRQGSRTRLIGVKRRLAGAWTLISAVTSSSAATKSHLRKRVLSATSVPVIRKPLPDLSSIGSRLSIVKPCLSSASGIPVFSRERIGLSRQRADENGGALLRIGESFKRLAWRHVAGRHQADARSGRKDRVRRVRRTAKADTASKTANAAEMQ
jgi:hypothetical protein